MRRFTGLVTALQIFLICALLAGWYVTRQAFRAEQDRLHAELDQSRAEAAAALQQLQARSIDLEHFKKELEKSNAECTALRDQLASQKLPQTKQSSPALEPPDLGPNSLRGSVREATGLLFELGDVDPNDDIQVANVLLNSDDEYMRALGLKHMLAGTEDNLEASVEYAKLSLRIEPIGASSLYAAQFLSEHLTESLRREFVSKVENDRNLESWPYAVALAKAGDDSYLDYWGQKALETIRERSSSRRTVSQLLTACRMHDFPQKDQVVLKIAQTGLQGIHKELIPLLQRIGSPDAIKVLEALAEDTDPSVSGRAKRSLSALRGGG